MIIKTTINRSRIHPGILHFWIIAGILIFLLGGTNELIAQERFQQLSNELTVLSVDQPGLDQLVDLSVSNMPIQEFFRSLASANKLNINVDPALNIMVTNTFTDVPVRDLLVFMSRQYDLEMSITGRILSISKFEAPPQPVIEKPISITYDTLAGLVSMDLRRDSLASVTRYLTGLTGQNIIYIPDLQSKMVSVFVQRDSLDDALEKLAISNGIALLKKDDYYLFFIEEKPVSTNPLQQTPPSRSSPLGTLQSKNFPYQARSVSDISINAVNVPILDIVNTISQALHVNYFVYSDLKEPVTLNLDHVSYEELLENTLNGSNYTYQIDQGIFLIGERNLEGIRKTQVVKLQYRSILDISKIIPEKLKNGLTIQEFPDLNSLILSGSQPLIEEIKHFLTQIDATVPVIMIEVMILNFQKGYTLSTGISAGVGDKPVKTSGTVGPGVDITLGAESVNNIINSINGAGLINLGKVTPNFYLSIKLLEDQGVLKVRSTPKLSTLNGHEAVMKISKTEYYLEETSQIFANASTTQTKIKQYKPVNADFSITITPIVSGDNQITMQIQVDQSDFTGDRLTQDAPPNQISRNFTSMIRVKNEEMILLGGLDEGTMKESGSGFPILSRIPILKWIFSSRERVRNDSRLNIFIKPTVIY